MPILKRTRILEAQHVEGPVVRYADETYGVKALKMNGRGWNSWPDRLFLFPKPWLLFIEFKTPDNPEPTDNQLDNHCYLEILGYDIHVATTKEEGIWFIDLQAKLAGLGAARLSEKGHRVRTPAVRRRVVPRPGSR